MASPNSTNMWQEFRVSDAYVWSEIHYLDSATDYREYLPQHGVHLANSATIPDNELILLDSSSHLCRSHSYLCLLFVVLFLIFGGTLFYLLQ
jgi:hypothetical protein